MKVNATHIFVAGGETDGFKPENKTYMLEWKTRTWTSLPDVPIPGYRRLTGVCAHVPFTDEVLVVGGYENSTLTFDLETMTWGDLMANPGEAPSISSAQAVPYQGSLLLVAGNYGNGNSDLIYLYDLEHRGWTKLEQRLDVERADHVALLAPESLSACQ